MAKFFKTEYGRKKMIFEGYVYVRNAFSKDKQTKYWICELNEQKGQECDGRAVTSLLPESDNFNVVVTYNHSHPPGILYMERQRSPSTESIKSDCTEPGIVPDLFAFTNNLLENTINESINEIMDQTINDEVIVKEMDTINSSIIIQPINNVEKVLEINPPTEETSLIKESPPVLTRELSDSKQISSISETIVNVDSNNNVNIITQCPFKTDTKRHFPSAPNGFFFWSAEYRRKQNVKGFTENYQMQKILGEKWRSLPIEERRFWMEKAKQKYMENLGNNKIPLIIRRTHKKKKLNILRDNSFQQNLPTNELNQNNNVKQNESDVERSSSNQINIQQNKNVLLTSSDNNYDNEIKRLDCFVAQMLLLKYRNNNLTSSEELHNELANAGIFISLFNLNIYLIKMKLIKKKYLVPLYSSPNEGQFFLIGADKEWHKFKATKYFTKHSIHELDCLNCLKLRRKERSNTWGQHGRAILRFGELDDNFPILHHPNCKGDSLECLHSLHYSPDNAPNIENPQLDANIQENISNNFENATPLQLLEESVRINTSLQEQTFNQQNEHNYNSISSPILRQLLEKSQNTSITETNNQMISIDEDEQITNTSSVTITTTNNSIAINEGNNQTNDYLSKLIIGLSEISKQLNLSFIQQKNNNNFILLPSNTLYSKRSLSIIPMTDNVIILNVFIGSILQETLRY